ncbi:MAG: hypothetical protein ABIA74_06210 [bacterium]
MKNILKALAFATLVAVTANASTDKTFLQVRPHGVNLAMESTTWRDLLITEKEDEFGAHFQVTPFYMDSDESSDLGRYFGINNKNVFELSTLAPTLDFNIKYINVAFTHQNTVTYSPEQTAWGVRIDYYQSLDKVLKGLFFKVCLPIVNVDNDMHLKVVSTDATEQTNLINYYKGDFSSTTTEALKYAKINGGQSDTEVADIDIVLGYKIVRKEKVKFGVNIGLTIPTGNDADGVWVFEPISGNNEHWGLGAGLDLCAKVWEDGKQYFRIDLVANYRYLFESSEDRTLRVRDDLAANKLGGGSWRYSQYRLVGQGTAGQAPTAGTIKPLANISTLNVDVEPGSQLDAILGVAYANGGFSIDLGYNLFWKEREDVDKKADLPVNYFLLNTTGDIITNAEALVTADLDFGSAETPSYLTHKIYGGLGYIFKEWDTPLMLGIGAQYEFASDNEEIEGWGIWGKLGIKF